ncbi:AhpC/TSA family protein [Pseudoalteromonas sp. MMG013]|uniref:peroxiredoxin-like family protein n=1 Tax=unclassified Pseudoalteromonas TaxID=194690 RepID=UPI001B36ACB0|nr:MULTISPECIES: peroxiredoxin-like family protein [unclassified Pseudoalteromonas]MBQ4846642.1 AhpC/TSA family protein [Pseudoalteromonas sp. MMG005]MBQ4851658.1 AhpC/TSA family protein [Pseudoalteromonas sp. MMG012]MBQ4864543.1 AhpC/TSA family protein [Pseudoalteromonas sp. MMG013]
MRFLTAISIIIIGFFVSPITHAAQVTNIESAPERVRPLLPGLDAPQLTLRNKDNKSVNLNSLYADNKATVIVVYRGGWCPYCSRQLAGIQKIEAQIAGYGAKIIAVSPDSPAALAKSKIDSPNYQLLSDSKLALAQALGVAYFLDEKTAKAYRDRMGVNFVDLDGQSKVALPVPAVFVVDKKGLVQFQYTNPNYKVRLDESVLLAAVKAASIL